MEKMGAKTGKKRVRIGLLGHFEILLNGVSVGHALKKTRQGRALVAFLVLHRGRIVPYAEIYDSIACGKNSRSKENSVKVLACRTRSLLADEDASMNRCIISGPGGYGWNMDMTEDVDVLRMEQLCEDLLQMRSYSGTYKRKLETLMTLYPPKLLPEFHGKPWAYQYAKGLKRQLIAASEHIQPLFHQANEGAIAVRFSFYCYGDETPRLWQGQEPIRVVPAKTEQSGATKDGAILDLQQAAYEDRGMYIIGQPSNGTLDRAIHEVETELSPHQGSGDALLCEYTVFKMVYEFQRRSLCGHRHGFYLVVASLDTASGQSFSLFAIADAMQQLGAILKETLSQGDTVSGYDATTYVALVQEEDPDRVRDKLQLAVRRFEQDNVIPDGTVTCLFRRLTQDGPFPARMKLLEDAAHYGSMGPAALAGRRRTGV